jgi:hypothetical protein
LFRQPPCAGRLPFSTALREGWTSATEARRLLERVRQLQHAPLVLMPTDDLKPDR